MATTLPESRYQDRQITVDRVRAFIVDRNLADNPLDMDLEFGDDEIQNAMGWAAMEFNETPPYSLSVDPLSLPYGHLFLNGIAAALYLFRLQALMKQDIDYNAGNAQVEITKRRIEHLKELYKLFGEEFKTKLLHIKQVANLESCYAQVG